MSGKTLRFEGYSDDTFYCVGPGIDVGDDNCANGKPIAMLVRASSGALIVIGQYGTNILADGWLISISAFDPGDADTILLPNWPMRFTPGEHANAHALIIEAPEDVSVELIGLAETQPVEKQADKPDDPDSFPATPRNIETVIQDAVLKQNAFANLDYPDLKELRSAWFSLISQQEEQDLRHACADLAVYNTTGRQPAPHLVALYNDVIERFKSKQREDPSYFHDEDLSRRVLHRALAEQLGPRITWTKVKKAILGAFEGIDQVAPSQWEKNVYGSYPLHFNFTVTDEYTVFLRIIRAKSNELIFKGGIEWPYRESFKPLSFDQYFNLPFDFSGFCDLDEVETKCRSMRILVERFVQELH